MHPQGAGASFGLQLTVTGMCSATLVQRSCITFLSCCFSALPQFIKYSIFFFREYSLHLYLRSKTGVEPIIQPGLRKSAEPVNSDVGHHEGSRYVSGRCNTSAVSSDS